MSGVPEDTRQIAVVSDSNAVKDKRTVFKLKASHTVWRALISWIERNQLNPLLCTFRCGMHDLRSSDDRNPITIKQLFEARSLSNDEIPDIEVRFIKGVDLEVVFPLEYPRAARPEIMITVPETANVKTTLKKLFKDEDLIIFDSDWNVNGVPVQDGDIMRDLGIEPGSSAAIVRVLNADSKSQLARVQANSNLMKEKLDAKKRKTHKVGHDMDVLQAEKRSHATSQANHVKFLSHALELAQKEFLRMEAHYKTEIFEREQYLQKAAKTIKEYQEQYDALVAKRPRLEAAVAAQAQEAGGKQAADAPAGHECVLCFEVKPPCLFIPCGHELCRDCGAIIIASGYNCPICRGAVTGTVPLHS